MPLSKNKVHKIYLLIDLFLIFLSFFSSFILSSRYNSIISGPLFKEYLLVFIVWGSMLVFILNESNLYSTDRSLNIITESWKVYRSVFFSTVLITLVIFSLHLDVFSRFIFFVSAFYLALSLSFWRMLKRLWIRKLLRSGHLIRKVLIIGSGQIAEELIDEIRSCAYLGLVIVGLINDKEKKDIQGVKFLGEITDMEEVVKKNFVEEIFIAGNPGKEKLALITQKAKTLNISMRLAIDNFELAFDKIILNYVGYIPLITFHQRSLHGTEMIAKRIFDLVVTTILLFILLPFFAIIAILVKLCSPGPILYVSKRCGKNGRVFNFYKFRSMFNQAHDLKEKIRHQSEVSGPMFKIKNDPRVTRMGKLMRRFSIDELPQLFNVLKGDMSLVGPRPPTPDEVEEYKYWQMQRLNITPGITCLWQIRGRSELSFHKLVKLDLWYINNWSFGLDLAILWRTIPAVLKGKGAY
jgi:exopolysaccharide biosynthesis polyprenyl glycosylphosphotransferase